MNQSSRKDFRQKQREHTHPKSIRTKSKNDSICIVHHLISVSSQPSKFLHPIFYNLHTQKFHQQNTSKVRTTSNKQMSGRKIFHLLYCAKKKSSQNYAKKHQNQNMEAHKILRFLPVNMIVTLQTLSFKKELIVILQKLSMFYLHFVIRP